jgi:hypothetical protein
VHCFACGAEIRLATGERVGFRDSCPGCSADVHVCRNCVHRDPGAYNECREPNADWVRDRERANRCEYFAPGEGAGGAGAAARDRARSRLDDLFKK